MPEHQQKRRLQNFDRILETGNSIRICEIAGEPNDKEIAAPAVERIFRRDPRNQRSSKSQHRGFAQR